MNKNSRWAAIVSIVCGAELVAVAIIGGAGIAAFASIEAAIVATLLGAVSLWIILDRRRRSATSSKSAAGRRGPQHRNSSAHLPPVATNHSDPTDGKAATRAPT